MIFVNRLLLDPINNLA